MPAVINSIEWWLTYQAKQVICCSKFMIREVVDGFELPIDKVHLVPNGVDLAVWATPAGTKQAKREPLVIAWGRVQYEKGFQVLARAVGSLRQRVPGIRSTLKARNDVVLRSEVINNLSFTFIIHLIIIYLCIDKVGENFKIYHLLRLLKRN